MSYLRKPRKNGFAYATSTPILCDNHVAASFAPCERNLAVADPGFPRGGGINPPWCCQHTILPNFPKNCMKLKEFGPRGGHASKILLGRSATA